MNFKDLVKQSSASQDKIELEELLNTISEINPENILEIGVHLGHSMRVWRDALNPEKLLGLERDTCYPYPDLKVLTGVDSGTFACKNNVISFFGNSDIDFMFIDGDHLYEPVKRDFELYSPLVRKGGIVAFHDVRITDNATVEVYKLWAELKEQYNYGEIFSKTGTGTGVIFL